MIFAALLGYLLGSIPFSFIVPKLVKGIDVRTIGSGNVGATNVYRCCGLPWAILAFLGDFAKGLTAVLISSALWGYQASLIAGLAAMLGHCYTIVLGFKGGKGVATFAGILLSINPLIFAILGVLELSLIFATRIVSLASIIAATALPILAYLISGDAQFILFSLVIGLFIIFQHRANIGRLLSGEEKRLTGKKKEVS